MNSTSSPASRAGSCGGADAAGRWPRRGPRGASCPGGRRGVQRQPSAAGLDAGAHVVGARAVRAERRRRAGRPSAAGRSPGRPSIRSTAGDEEEPAGDQRRDRVAGQADQRHAAEAAGHQRLARAHRDAVEVERRGRAPSAVRCTRSKSPTEAPPSVTIRSAPRGEARRRRRGSRGCRGRSAGAAPRRRRPRASPSGRRRSRRRSGRGPGASPGMTSSSPVGDQRDHRAARDRHAAGVHRGEEREVDRAEPARGGDAGAGGEVAAGGADVAVARRGRRGARSSSPSASTSSWITHEVGALGHRRAGEDAHRLAGADRAREARAGGRGADDARGGRRRAASAARTA